MPVGISRVYEALATRAITEFAWQRDDFIADTEAYLKRRHEGPVYAAEEPSRSGAPTSPLAPEKLLEDTTTKLHAGFFGEDTQWGSIDEIQRKLEDIYWPLVDAGYMKR